MSLGGTLRPQHPVLVLPGSLYRFSVLTLIAIAGAVALSACAESETSRSGVDPRSQDEGSKDGETSTFATSDASAGDTSKMLRGSPLCGVTAETCLPDDDGMTSTPYGACATAPPDDAGASTEADTDAKACRLTKKGEDYAPSCVESKDGGNVADWTGIDGVPCQKSADCAPGFDCIHGDNGPSCRRYCCMGTCEGQTSLNGGPTFCDVQRLVEPAPHLAPVCMPIKACKLLVEGECAAGETCAVVTEKGATGCVPRGPARAGEPCEELHCGAGLTCLGHPGNRRCYTLCKTDRAGAAPASPRCEAGQTCTTGSLFLDNNIGVCKDP